MMMTFSVSAMRVRSDVLVDDLLEIFLLGETDHRFEDLPALEEKKSRDAANLVLEGDGGVFVDVQFADGDLAGVFARERVDRRPEALAGPAPLGPEVHQHRRPRL